MTEEAQVKCYSGTHFAERPVSFSYAGQWWPVSAVERRWREPDGLYFVVHTEDDRRFRLTYLERDGRWLIDPIRPLPLKGVDHHQTDSHQGKGVQTNG